MTRSIKLSTRAYERWLRVQLGREVIETDLRKKHEKMRADPFAFFRATYWRWAEEICDICPELAGAPSVLAVGDIHLENFGTWRDVDGRLVWGVNDFDESAEMPYVLDLVRLATSAVLGCGGLKRDEDICANILKGYRRGLSDPQPIVLDHGFEWLRKLVVVPEKERTQFWAKMSSLAPHANPPARYAHVIMRAAPDPSIRFTFCRCTAGTGSLGRPRWIGFGEWRGALIVREAKAVVPSGWTRQDPGCGQELRCEEIATGCYRSPDPWYKLHDSIVVRRLSPNNRKIEAETYPSELASKKMLRLMGHEIAAIHLGRAGNRQVIECDLEGRKPDWLPSAVERAVDFVRADYKEWKKTT